MSTEYLLPIFLMLSALSVLGWNYFRGRQLGNRLQILVILLPEVIYLGLALGGIHLSLGLFLSFCLIAVGVYILLVNNPVMPPAAAKPEPKPSQPKADLQQLQGIFGVETFYATSSQPFQGGFIFKGNLRSEADVAYRELSQNLTRKFGDRYELFLVCGQERKPVVIILPPQPVPITPLWQKLLALVLVVTGIATSAVLASQFLQLDLSNHLGEVLPFALGVVVFLGLREYAQRYVARQAGLTLTMPFLLPSLQLGAFGMFSRVLSPFPDRRLLFDFATAPALVGVGLSTFLFITGLVLTPGIDRGIEVPSQIFQTSVLVGTIGKLLLGKSLATTFITLHPLVIFGWLGMVITSLNLLPAGQLEGGRIIQAMYGRQVAGWATLLTLIFLGLGSIINPLALYWGGIIFLLLRDQERPMHNELSELDNDRDALGLFLLFWMVVTLLPMNTNMANYLGIGS
ncbi:MAG: site-2 protease family protein [Cyanobacteria bacterium KgW148]|nr:site-2 protease family protein [Cyanobacteria bacterium KgW148]